MPAELHPAFPAELIALFNSCTWGSKTSGPDGVALGCFFQGNTQQYLIVTSGGTDGTWAAASPLPAGFGEVLIFGAGIPVQTPGVMQGGTANADGSVSIAGFTFRITLRYDGANWTAVAIPAAAL